MLMLDPVWQKYCCPVHSQGPKQAFIFVITFTLQRSVKYLNPIKTHYGKAEKNESQVENNWDYSDGW